MTMEYPWIPFYAADYLHDTHDLSLDEHGCYMLLLMLCWRRQDCGLPNDMAWIRGAVRQCTFHAHGNQLKTIIPRVLAKFFTLDSDGMWRQPRLVAEREKCVKFSRKQRENAAKRWSKHKEINGLSDAVAMPARTGSQSHKSLTTTEYEERAARKESGNGVLAVSTELQSILQRKRWHA